MAVELMNPYLFISLVLLETAHVVSPFVLAVTNRGFRGVVRTDWWAYIGIPIAVLMTVFVASHTIITVPQLITAYILFNSWHFSMQNFGILQLTFPRARKVNLVCAFLGTTLGMIFVPLLTQIHHWVSDIGISRRAAGSGQWLYLVLVIALAPIAIFWNKLPWVTFGWQPPGFVIEMAKTLMIFRYSLSFAHFAMSARIWRFSDPQVRATIGAELFRS